MKIIEFDINAVENPYNITANVAHNLKYTLEVDANNYPQTISIQYDIDGSGKDLGIQFSDGSTSIKNSINIPQRFNNNIIDAITLQKGETGTFGINICIVEDNTFNDSINVSYTQASMNLDLMHISLMKKVKQEINRGIKKGLEQHIRDFHSKSIPNNTTTKSKVVKKAVSKKASRKK